MRITPLDIRKQEFRKTMRGLDSDEVYAFLNTVADEYEAVLSDNKKLREHIVELEDRIKEYKNIETNLRNTLLTAEKLTAEAKESARREAGLILREAEADAERAAEAIRAHTLQLRREILELKKQKDNYLTRLKTLLDSHRRMLEGFEEDFSQVDREIEIIGRRVDDDTRKAVTPPRISREKITEKYTGEAHDKVTWGDERKREEEARPSMPRPGWQGESKPGRGAAPCDDSGESTPTSDARDANPAETEKVGMPPIGAELIGAVDEIRKPAEDAPTFEAGDWKGAPDSEEGELRRAVTQGIEEKLYPDIRMDEGGAGTGTRQAPAGAGAGEDTSGPDSKADQHKWTDTSGRPGKRAPEQAGRRQEPAAPGTDVFTAGQAQSQPESGVERPQPRGAQPEPRAGQPRADTVPETGAAHAEDSWRKYEVRDEKPDWNNYEIPVDRRSQEAVRVEPNDNEVEEALSSLREVTDEQEDQAEDQGPEQAIKPGESKGVGDKWRTEIKKQPEPKGAVKDAQKRTVKDVQGGSCKPSQGAGQGEDSESTWSMEQLRKNLSSLGNDEDK